MLTHRIKNILRRKIIFLVYLDGKIRTNYNSSLINPKNKTFQKTIITSNNTHLMSECQNVRVSKKNHY